MNITITLIAQMAAFILLIWFVNKVLWGPMSAMMEARQKRIADGLAAGEKGKHEQELAEKRAIETLKESKDQAAEIIALAQKRASEVVEEAKETARTEGARIVTAANAEIEREVNQAKEALRSQVSVLAIAGAEKVLKREIDAKSHDDLLKDLAAQKAMAEISTISRPYAEAIFSLASESSNLGEWSDMLALAAMVAVDDDMQALISNTNVNKDQLTSIYLDVCGDKLTELGKNTIKVLVESRRLSVLPEIARQFETLKAEAEKTVEAEVISAFEVSQEQQQQIADKLKQRLGRDVTLTCRVDNTLIGGVIIKAGDLVIDGSAIGQINKLSVALAG